MSFGKRPYLFICGVFLMAVSLSVPSNAHDAHDHARMHDAIEKAQARVESATTVLRDLRESQDEARAPLQATLAQLQHDTLMLRQDAEQRLETKSQKQSEADSMARDVATLNQTYDTLYRMIEDYRRGFESRQLSAVSQRYQESLRIIDECLSEPPSTNVLSGSLVKLLRLGDDWNRDQLAGAIFSGTCLTSDGLERDGMFVTIGPLAYFADHTDKALAGMVVTRTGSRVPRLVKASSPVIATAIVELMSGDVAHIPIDPSGGDAIKVAAKQSNLVEHLTAGGVIIIPLLFIGLFAAALAVSKMVALSRIRTPSDVALNDIVRCIRRAKTDEAAALVAQLGDPYGVVLLAGLQYRHLPASHLEEVLQERALATLPTLDKHLGMLAVLGGVSPLLGLLGTVTGMMYTFERVALFGTGDAKLLSGGISEALVTTEVGLMIAVPILIVHAMLTRRVRTIVAHLEQTVLGFMNRMQEAEGSND
jgi:biopolymer transport protein ExbB